MAAGRRLSAVHPGVSGHQSSTVVYDDQWSIPGPIMVRGGYPQGVRCGPVRGGGRHGWWRYRRGVWAVACRRVEPGGATVARPRWMNLPEALVDGDRCLVGFAQALAAQRADTAGLMMRTLRTWLIRLLGVAVAFAVSFSFAYLLFRDAQARFRELEQYGVETKAVVVRVDSQDHGTVYYRYSVDGRVFSDSSSSDPPNPESNVLAMGDEIAIIYNSISPGESCACRAQDVLDSNRLGMQLFGLGGGVVVSVFGAAFMRALRPQ